MNTKVINLIERNADEELKSYFANLENSTPLDCHDELILLDYFSPTIVKTYINRFRLSETAEIVFIEKAPADIRLAYINCYGLRETTQKHIITNNLRDVARDFMRLRHFSDIDFLLANGSPDILRPYLSLNKLEEESQVLTLLHHDNPTLFQTYALKWIISENIKREIITEKLYKAFNCIMYKFYRLFLKKSKKTTDFKRLLSTTLAAEALPSELQTLVLTSHDRFLIEILLKTCPLSPEAQAVLWEYNYDSEWLKFHVEHIYGMGGYRFETAYENKLFKALSSKNLDDCLTTFRHQDDVSFVQCASPKAVKKYIKSFWLSDDAQVALLGRGNCTLAQELISRYSPEYGLCWQAEVELVKTYRDDTIKLYISFHTMCWEALSHLKEKSPGLAEYYYSLHPY